MLPDDRNDVARCKVQSRHEQRIEDNPHAVILLPKHERISNAFDPFQIIDQTERRVVRQKDGVMSGIGRFERDDHHQIRRQLLDRDALTNDFRRQLRLSKLLSILRLHLRDVRIRPNFER